MELTLRTKNGVVKLDEDVANYIQLLMDQNESLRLINRELKIRNFKLESESSRGWFYRLIYKNKN